MGKSFVIDKCIVEGNELKIFFRIILRGYDVVGEEGGRQWLMGQVKNNEFEIDTVTYIIRILNQDTLYAAPLLMDSIPPKMEAILSADTLQLCFYFLHFSTTYDCGSRWDDAFLDGSMPFDEVFQIIRAYYKKYCPLDTIARVGINKYKIYLVKQTSKTRQGIINKSKTGRVQAPGSLYASANGKKISGKADHRAMQILLLKNRRILIMP